MSEMETKIALLESKIENIEKYRKEDKEYMKDNFKTLYTKFDSVNVKIDNIKDDLKGLLLKFFFGIVGAIVLSGVVGIIAFIGGGA